MERKEIEDALIAAHRAGNTEHAMTLTNALESLGARPQVSNIEGIAAHGTQGLSLGFADELGAGAATLASYLDFRPEADAFKGMSFGERYEGLRDTARGRMGAYKEDNPVLATGAEIAGGIMSPAAIKAASLLRGAKGADLVRKSTALGGLLGGASGTGYSSADSAIGVAGDAALGAGVGAAAGYAFPAVGNRLARAKATRVAGKTSTPYKQAVKVLRDNGIPMSTGQRTGVNWMKTAESTLEEVPFGGKPLQALRERARQKFQKRLFEITANDKAFKHDMLTREALDDLSDTLSRQYAKALGGKSINIADDAFLDALANIEAKHTGFVDSSTARKIRQVVNSFLEEASSGPARTGKWYQAQRSIFRERGKGTSKLAGLYNDLKTTLDEAFARSAGKNVKGNLDARYGQYKQLETLFNRVAGGAEGAEGFIPPGQLAKLAGKNAGTRQWQELTRAAAAVLPDRLGNSGTAQRHAILSLLGPAAFDPMSLLYLPAAGRVLASQAAQGRGALDVSRLLPSGALLQNPNIVRGASSAGLLTQ